MLCPYLLIDLITTQWTILGSGFKLGCVLFAIATHDCGDTFDIQVIIQKRITTKPLATPTNIYIYIYKH